MEKLLNYIKKEKLNIYYPPDEIENWKNLKNKYIRMGYRWVDFSMDYSMSKIRRYDRKNQREYNKRKKDEKKMRNTFRGPGNIPIVYPPPSPSNMERYLILERWSKNDIYNISNISVYLYSNFGLKPCSDYEPDNIFVTYNNYSQRHHQSIEIIQRPSVNNYIDDRRPSYENTIYRRNTYAPSSQPPSLPPPPKRAKSMPPVAPLNLRPSAPPVVHREIPPSYNQLLDQLA